MESPQLETIEIGNKLEKAESDVINGLKLEAFDKDAQKENIDEMKDVLKSTKINVITSVAGVVPEVKEELSLLAIATEFDEYVEQGDGWKVQVKAWKPDTPEWIKYIVEHPKNNDLAYFVQKIAELVEYQTARVYTKEQIKAEDVWVDQMFGNQTRRALAGLKNRIENDTTKEKITFLKKSKITDLITQNTSGWSIDAGKLNTALDKYNLVFDDSNWIKPKDWYEPVDPNSSNYAVKSEGTTTTDTAPTEVVWTDSETEIIDIKKKLDSAMYDKYTDEIEKIKISTFINKYKVQYPWIEKCFASVNQELVTINESNPYFQISYKNSEIVQYNNAQTNKISMRECIDPKTFKFDQNMFFEKLSNELKPIIESNDIAEKNKDILKKIRWKKFSKSYLFGTKYDNDARYTTYFEAFDNNEVEIDSGEQYTEIIWTNLNFRLDDSGLDKDYNKDKVISINKITNEQWVVDDQKLKEELASMVSDIIEKNLS